MSELADNQVVLQTERTFSRLITFDDFKDLAEILQDPEVMYAYEHAFSDQEVREWLERQIKRYQDDGFGLWAVISKKTGDFMGQVGLTVQQTPLGKEVEIGWLLKRKFWHQGIATEAALGCKRYAFDVLKKKKVVSIIRDTNSASRKVAERLGMKPEFSFVKHYYGMDMPHIVYSILNR